jgi:hypothetical protein
MKTNSLVSLVTLAATAAVMNLSWAADGRISIPMEEGVPCPAGVGKDSGAWIESWMPPSSLDPLAGGCEGCTLSDTIVQTYCESRGTDCDGFWGMNESYKWTREKYIYQCGQPGQPGYGWYVECSTWVQEDCCDDGSEGLPPTSCTHEGAAACSARGDN